MAHKGSINEEETQRDVPRFKSSLEDIDFAVYKFVDEIMDLSTKTNKGFRKHTTSKMMTSKETKQV